MHKIRVSYVYLHLTIIVSKYVLVAFYPNLKKKKKPIDSQKKKKEKKNKKQTIRTMQQNTRTIDNVSSCCIGSKQQSSQLFHPCSRCLNDFKRNFLSLIFSSTLNKIPPSKHLHQASWIAVVQQNELDWREWRECWQCRGIRRAPCCS